MRLFKLILQLLLIYSFYKIGVLIQGWFNLFIPGSIIGMLLLFLLLSTGLIRTDWVDRGASLLIRYLPLLFLPIIVGIINYFELFSGKGVWLLVIVVVSTIGVMLSSGFITDWLLHRKERIHD